MARTDSRPAAVDIIGGASLALSLTFILVMAWRIGDLPPWWRFDKFLTFLACAMVFGALGISLFVVSVQFLRLRAWARRIVRLFYVCALLALIVWHNHVMASVFEGEATFREEVITAVVGFVHLAVPGALFLAVIWALGKDSIKEAFGEHSREPA